MYTKPGGNEPGEAGKLNYQLSDPPVEGRSGPEKKDDELKWCLERIQLRLRVLG